MAATKNTTAEKTTAKPTKKAKEYKVIGESFQKKSEADERLKEVSKKGFKDVGLMVRDDEFVILFGTYRNEHITKVNAEKITEAGFKVQIV